MTIARTTIIQFLDAHWRDTWTYATLWDLAPQAGDSLAELSIRKLEELRSGYVAELEKLSDEQLLLKLNEAREEQEAARPFHQPNCEADFSHFGKCPYLTIQEAVALSLGKDPRAVSWSMVEPHVGKSSFAQEFANRLDLVERAVEWGELSKAFPPLTFLTWAHQYKITVPAEFIHHTFVRGEPIKYWHDLCLEQASEIKRLRMELASLEEVVEQELAAAEQSNFDDWVEAQDYITKIEEAHAEEFAQLQAKLSHAQTSNDQLHKINQTLQDEIDLASTIPLERKSLLTLVIAMAVDGYGFNPNDKKSPVPTIVADAAHRVGLKITDDSVRKYLKAGSNLKGFDVSVALRLKPKSV